MSCEWNQDLNSDQLILVNEMRKWVQVEGEEQGLRGRTDDDFLLMFLRSCDFDLDLTQKTLSMYYENRTKYPQWCSDKDLNHPHIKPLLQINNAVALQDQDPAHSSVLISRLSRLSNFSQQMDNTNKLYAMMLEVIARRRNCQLNGCVVIFDLDKCPWWLATKMLSFSTLKAIVQALVVGVPVRTEALVMVNAPFIAGALLKLCQPFIPSYFKNKIYCFSDWSKVSKIVPLDALPEEFGGSAGPMTVHEEAFLEEMLAFNDYLVDDNQYGYITETEISN